jgi:Clp amino terminal domain, pathogenicity island component/UvrB/uvrC motif
MFERFTDRARRVVVLAQEEARLLSHGFIGTEHLLLGLIREDEGVAAKTLRTLDIELQTVRDRVREIIGQGSDEQPSGHIPFTPRAKRVLEFSLREALQLGHDYIGTEHILLGLIREGEGVAAQVLVELGADLNVVRQRVIGLRHGATSLTFARGERPGQPVTVERRAVPGRRERALVAGFRVRLTELETRLAAVEQRVGFGPDVSELDREIVRVLGEKHAAADVQDYEQAAELRDTERRLTADKAGKQQEWSAAHPDLESLGETVERLEAEVGRLRQMLRQHGADHEPADLPEAGQEPEAGSQAGEA